ncbi:hypothetical protein BH11MYX1_BH11MYX1_06730 [soil metagenome]
MASGSASGYSSAHYVDLSYRGLVLGRRVKLTQVRPSTGYLELGAPMPVGTAIGLTAEDGTVIEATVTEVREQIANSDAVAGMTIRPRLEGQVAAWWKAKAELPDVVKVEAAPQIGIVRSKRSSTSGGVPELMDDGRNTAVQEAIDPGTLAEPIDAPIDAPGEKDTQVIAVVEAPVRESHPTRATMATMAAIVDDGKRTVAMDAVDLVALGLEPMSASGPIPIIAEDTFDDDDASSAPESGPAGAKKKRKRR